MRPIKKGNWPVTPVHGKRVTFTDWTKAIPFLKERTGSYCHLCEMKVTNALAIEHIMPRKMYPERESDWDNFLLACHSCNSSKGSKMPSTPYENMYYWPHLHNTIFVFEYGTVLPFVKPSDTLNRNQRAKAVRLIRLYSLNKQVTASGESDPRWLEKMQTLKNAIDSLIEYHHKQITLDSIVRLACSSGFISIWLAVFTEEEEVKKSLISSSEYHLKGTDFYNDEFEPVARNPDDTIDPV
ncbi:MAG: HNH endonuclease [Chlorobium sp.]